MGGAVRGRNENSTIKKSGEMGGAIRDIVICNA